MPKILNQIEHALMLKMKATPYPRDFQNEFAIVVTRRTYMEITKEIIEKHQTLAGFNDNHHGHDIYLSEEIDNGFIIIQKPNFRK